MYKSSLIQRLSRGLGQKVKPQEFRALVSCFAQHAGYLARFFGIDAADLRYPEQISASKKLNEPEIRLFSIYCGYDLTQPDAPPLW